jgi:tetratricopeptide (TPR) repeat protein
MPSPALPPAASSGTVFISYSRTDSAKADAIADALERHGFTVKIDRRNLEYGEEWLRELEDFIRASDTIVWLVSPASLASRACAWELNQVRTLSKRLVPVVIEPTDLATLPEALAKIHVLPASGTFDHETHLPVLVRILNTDMKWIKEHTRLANRAHQWIERSRNSAVLLRGSELRDAERWKDRRPTTAPTPSDDILELLLASRRATQARQRTYVALSLLTAIMGVGLAAYAFWQRDRADQSYTAARTNLDRLVRDLAAEMQNEDGMPIAVVNRILEVGKTLAQSLEKAAGGDPELEASRAAMYYQFGKTYQRYEERNSALAASDRNLELWRRLHLSQPGRNDWRFAYVESLNLAGDLEREKRNNAGAADYFQQSVRHLKELESREPDNAVYAMEYSRTLVRLGDLDRFANAPEASRDRYLAAFALTRRALRLDTSEPSLAFKRELSWNFNKLGDAQLTLKAAGDALPHYEKALCLRQHIAAAKPNNTEYRRDVGWTFDKMSAAKAALNDINGALDAQYQALLIRRALVQSDEKKLIWKRELGLSLHQLGDLHAKLSNHEAALAFYLAAASVRRELKAAGGTADAAKSFDDSMAAARAASSRWRSDGAPVNERPWTAVIKDETDSASVRFTQTAPASSSCVAEVLAQLRTPDGA